MAIIAIETTDPIPIDYINKVRNKFKSNSLVSNPFKGELFQFGKVTIVDITPIYLNLPLYGFVLAAIIVLFLGRLTWAIAPFIGVGLLSVLWTDYFFYFMFKIGMRKNGYKGKHTRLKKADIIRRLIQWGR